MEAPIKRAQPCDPRVPAARAFRRWYTWVQAGAALAALAIGIAASTASYVLGTRVAVENARNAFHIVSFNLADVVRQSCYVPSVAFDALVAGLTPSTVRYDALAFREVAHNLMLLCPVVMDVETYRILPDADRDAWERRMSAARNHTIVVWGVTGTPSARLPEYIVTETSVIHADPVLFGLDVTPFLPPHADVIARARNDMQAGMFMMWDATTMQMLLMTLRPLIAPARLNSSVAVGPVDLSADVSGMPQDSAAFLPPVAPLAEGARSDSVVMAFAVMVIPARNLYMLIQKGIVGLPAALSVGTTSGTLAGRLNALLLEDVTECAHAFPPAPTELVEPLVALHTTAPVGCGTIILGGVVGDRAAHELDFTPFKEAPQAAIDQSLASADGVVSSFLIGSGGRVWMLTVASSTTYITDVRVATWSIIVIGISASVIGSLAVFGALHAILLPRRRQARLARQEVLQLKAAQGVQDEMVAFLSHEIRNPAHVIARSVEFLQELLPPGHAAAPDLRSIQESSEAIHRLVNDVVTFNAMRLEKLEVREQVVELRPLVARIVRHHTSMAQVPIEMLVDPRVPTAMISDPMRIQQILANGLTNAAKFCDAGVIRLLVNWVPALDSTPDLCQLPLLPNAWQGAAGFDAATAARILSGTVEFVVEDSGPGLSLSGALAFQPFRTSAADVATGSKQSESLSPAPSPQRSAPPNTPNQASVPRRHQAAGANALVFAASRSTQADSVDVEMTASESHSPSRARAASVTLRPVVELSDGACSTAGKYSAAQSRGHAASSTQFARMRGSGLGLPVSKMLCERLNGDLRLYRNSEREVTVYAATLPLVPPATAPRLLQVLISPPNGSNNDACVVLSEPSDTPHVLWGMHSLQLAGMLLYQGQAHQGHGESLSGATMLAEPPTTCENTPLPPLHVSTTALIDNSCDDVGASPTTGGTSRTVARQSSSPTAAAFDASSSLPSPTPRLGLHVLVVDDEKPNRLLLRRMLERIGCTCTLLEEGDEAMAELVRTGQLAPSGGASTQPDAGADANTGTHVERYDAVLMDVYMKRTNGLDTCRDMVQRGCTVPLIAATGNATSNLLDEGAFCAVLEKPFSLATLRIALTTHCDVASP